MGIREKINTELIQAMKSKDGFRLDTLRFINAAIHNLEIEKRGKTGKETELTDDDILGVLLTEAKKRKEAIDIYVKGGRAELAEKEGA